MKATFRLPSKAVQYGYVEIDVEVGDDAQPDTIGHVYYAYVEAFQAGERAQKAVSAPANPVLVDVLKQELGEPETVARSLAQVMSDEDVDTEAEARKILESELGPTTAVDDQSAPWDNEPPAAKKKPWEKGASKAPAVKVDLFG